MDSALAAREDATTILKLYELRQEPVLRRARQFMTTEFWPASAADVQAILREYGTDRNNWFRQVTGYWEMAVALVNHGVLAPDLFLEVSNEAFFVTAKLWPYLDEIREMYPHMLTQIQKLVERNPMAKQRLESMQGLVEKRRAGKRNG